MALDAGLIVAFATALAGLIVALSSRRKSDADTNKATVEAVVILIKPLTDRVTVLEAEVLQLRRRVAEFRRGVRLLCGQIAELGATPVWQPDEGDNGE